MCHDLGHSLMMQAQQEAIKTSGNSGDINTTQLLVAACSGGAEGLWRVESPCTQALRHGAALHWLQPPTRVSTGVHPPWAVSSSRQMMHTWSARCRSSSVASGKLWSMLAVAGGQGEKPQSNNGRAEDATSLGQCWLLQCWLPQYCSDPANSRGTPALERSTQAPCAPVMRR